jgi:dynein heavy chain
LKTIDINSARSRKELKDLTPFDIVAIQECEQMNVLIDVIKNSLEDLLRGLRGELNITDSMENLQNCLILGKVSAGWVK